MSEIHYIRFSIQEFEEIVHIYTPQLLVFGRYIVNDDNIVKDTIQDLFLFLWEKNGTHKIKNLKIYLFTALRNNLIKHIKKQEKIDLNFDFSTFKLSSEEINIDDVEENLKIIESAIDALNNNQKQLIYLKFYKGLNNDEIAEILGINKQSVANGIYRVISYLRKNTDLSIDLIYFHIFIYNASLNLNHETLMIS